MYKKILANLAYSPSSIEQLSFYASRLKKEKSIRRTGLVLIVISMFIQLFAAMVPPEKSLAASNNDVIRGGVSNLTELKSKYNKQADVRALYKRFGLDANDLNNGKNVSFNFQKQGANGTRTVGRINFASTKDNNLGSFGGSTFYSRSAAEWQGSEPAYYFNKLKGTDGHTYQVWVLKNCGNIAYNRVETKKPVPKPTPKPTKKPVSKPKPTPQPKPVAPTIVVQQTQTQVQVQEQVQVQVQEEEETPDTPDTPVTPEQPNIEKSKSVHNLTQSSGMAQSSDTIEYSLVTKNTGTGVAKDVDIEDYIGDVLDYADIDMTYLKQQDGQYDAGSKTVSWPNQDIPAKGLITKTFRVKVKAVIPSTNQPNATATDYDCKMQNGYGNETMVPVACPVAKEAVEQLPNTGPGTTAAVGFTVTVIAGYFFMRSRLLAKEVGIVKRTVQTGGF